MKLTPQEKRKHLRGAPPHIIDMVEEKIVLWANGLQRPHRGAKRPDETLAIAIAVEIEAARNKSLTTESSPTASAAGIQSPQRERRRALKASPSRMLLD